jgi:hypothetical protein
MMYRQWWANGNIICNEHQRPEEEHSQVLVLPIVTITTATD